MRIARQGNLLDNNLSTETVICYSAGRLVFPRSSINCSQLTCSYGRSISCLEQRRKMDPTIIQLDKLKRGNLPSNFEQNGKVHFDHNNGKKKKKNISDSLSYNTQIEILQNFIQSLSGPTSDSNSYTSVHSQIIEEQNGSISDPNEINGQNGQIESINRSQVADEVHQALSNSGNSQPEFSRSSQITSEIRCTSIDQLN